MKTKTLLLATLLSAALFRVTPMQAADAPTDAAKVGQLGELSRIRFEGQQTYSDAALKNGLRYRLDFLLAAEADAPLDGCLRKLEELLRSGYQHAGCPDANIHASLDAATNRIVIHITEGPQLFCGEVRATGLKSLAATNLIERFLAQTADNGLTNTTARLSNAATERLSNTIAAANQLHKPSPTALAAQALAMQMLTNQSQVLDKSPGLWEPETAARLDPASKQALAEAVTNAFCDLGHFFPRFTLDFKRRPPEKLSAPLQTLVASTNRAVAKAALARAEGRVVDLVIAVVDEGPACRVGEVQVLGLEQNSPAEVLHLLDIQPGARFTQSWLDERRQRIEDCGRFLFAEIAHGDPDPAGRVALTVRLAELPDAPPLTKPLSAQAEALLRLRRWFLAWESRGDDAVFRLQAQRTSGKNLTAEFVISPAGGVLLRADGGKTNSGATNASSFGFAVRPRQAGIYGAGLAKRLVTTNFHGNVSFTFKIKPKPLTNDCDRGLFDLQVGAGFHTSDTEPPFTALLDLAPVAFLHLSHETNTHWRLEGPDLAGGSDRFTLRADAATGRLFQLEGHEEFGTDDLMWPMAIQWSLTFEPGAFDRAETALTRDRDAQPNAYDPAKPIGSSLVFLSELLLRSPLVSEMLPASLTTNVAPERWIAAGKALDKLGIADLFAPLEGIFGGTNDEAEFVIPHTVDGADAITGNALASVVAMVLAESSKLLPHGSWPNVVARLIALQLIGEAGRLEPEFNQLFADGGVGPLGCLVLGAGLGSSGGRQVALRGLTDLSLESFQKDCRVLLNEDAAFGSILANFLRALGRLDDQDLNALTSLLPEADAAFLRETAALMRPQPKGTVSDAIQPALEHWWKDAVKLRLRDDLRKMSRPPATKKAKD